MITITPGPGGIIPAADPATTPAITAPTTPEICAASAAASDGSIVFLLETSTASAFVAFAAVTLKEFSWGDVVGTSIAETNVIGGGAVCPPFPVPCIFHPSSSFEWARGGELALASCRAPPGHDKTPGEFFISLFFFEWRQPQLAQNTHLRHFQLATLPHTHTHTHTQTPSRRERGAARSGWDSRT